MISLLGILFTLTLGHYLRFKRWQLLIEAVGLQQVKKNLVGFGIGQSLNIFLPYKLGDLFRIYFTSPNLTWLPIVCSALLIERTADISVLIFAGSLLNSVENNVSVILNLIVILSLFVLAVGAIFGTKSRVLRIDFRSKYGRLIALGTLSLRRALIGVSWLKFVTYTAGMWMFYVLSIYFLAEMNKALDDFKLKFESIYNNIGAVSEKLTVSQTLIFTIACLFFVVISPLSRSRNHVDAHQVTSYLLSRVETRIETREKYLISTSKNENVKKIFLGGSSALTMLVEKSVDGIDSLTVRKIAWDSAGSRTLRNQYFEMSSRTNSPNFPTVEKLLDVSNCFVYDMTYIKDGVTLADQIQISSKPEELISKVLDIYVANFPKIDRSESGSKITEYIEKKIVPIQLTHSSGQLEQVVNQINQEVIKLRFAAGQYDFHRDTYLIHGDLSLGNIMISEGEVVHFIDLLRQEVGRSRSIDLGKLLFSLRSGYETFDPERDSFLSGDKLTLKSTSTRASFMAEGAFKKYVDSHMPLGMWAEIEFHSKVHALRIIPYKVKHDEKNQLAWMIFTLNYLTVH
jgi:hypothetical protein